ncbi:hypothetical protein NL53_20625, partial [Vibrio variabilis]
EPEPEPEDEEDDWLTAAIEEVESPDFDTIEQALANDDESTIDELANEQQDVDVSSSNDEDDDWLTAAIDEVESPQDTQPSLEQEDELHKGLDEPLPVSGEENIAVEQEDTLAQQEQAQAPSKETPETP